MVAHGVVRALRAAHDQERTIACRDTRGGGLDGRYGQHGAAGPRASSLDGAAFGCAGPLVRELNGCGAGLGGARSFSPVG
jgi:hypothetical protein